MTVSQKISAFLAWWRWRPWAQTAPLPAPDLYEAYRRWAEQLDASCQLSLASAFNRWCQSRPWARVTPLPAPALNMRIYDTDDYPREGCTLDIKVLANEHYCMAVYAPNGTCIESYLPLKPSALGRMVREWCEGRAPKSFSPLD